MKSLLKTEILGFMRFLALLSMVWFFMWIFVYDMVIWNKILDVIVQTSFENLLWLVISAIVLAYSHVNRERTPKIKHNPPETKPIKKPHNPKKHPRLLSEREKKSIMKTLEGKK